MSAPLRASFGTILVLLGPGLRLGFNRSGDNLHLYDHPLTLSTDMEQRR